MIPEALLAAAPSPAASDAADRWKVSRFELLPIKTHYDPDPCADRDDHHRLLHYPRDSG
ncbi:hypothetical protein D3C75_1277070 [compost metagenome]